MTIVGIAMLIIGTAIGLMVGYILIGSYFTWYTWGPFLGGIVLIVLGESLSIATR